jgi:hypothetical protein
MAKSTKIKDYMQSALDVLRDFEIIPKEEDTRLAGLLNDVSDVDEAKVVAIAGIVKYMGSFNELVRDNIEQMKVADRYNDITKMFDSVRADSKKMLGQIEDDGKLDLGEKVANAWMKLSRGTTHKRFEKITDVYNGVSRDTAGQLDKEEKILSAYADFRMALKQAGVLAAELLETEEERQSEAQQAMTTAQDTLANYNGNDQAEKKRLEFAAAEAKQTFTDEDRKYQLIKDVAESLDVGYNVGETLITKLTQTHEVKSQVYRKSVVFFTTNEHVFTTLDAVYASQYGLNEGTQTLEAMKDGVNKGLEDVAEIGGKIEQEGIRAGYGATLSPESVQKLVDSIVEYQETSRQLIEEMRIVATKNAKDIDRIVNDGNARSVEAISKYSKASQ